MKLHLQPTGGRYPVGLAPYRTENIRAELDVSAEVMRLRIDDVYHIDAWCEFTIDRRAIEQALDATAADDANTANNE